MRFFDEIWECLNSCDLEQKFSKFSQIYSNFHSCDMNFNSDIFKLSAPSYSKICSIKSMKEIKQKLSEIYSLLCISKVPKATDLGKYFKLIKTKVTLSDKTVTNGFKLEVL